MLTWGLSCSAYDRAALHIRGPDATLNFPDLDYTKDHFMLVGQQPCMRQPRSVARADVPVQLRCTAHAQVPLLDM